MKRTLVIGLLLGLFAGSTALAQSITVTKPAVNEIWYKGAASPYTIVWTKQGQLPPTVIISLRNTADTVDVLTIAGGAQNSGSYPWTPPASVAAGPYRIRVWTPSASGTSAIFSIANVPSGPLKVTSPNGGESWPLNSSKPITWTPGAATGNVRIELYRNGTAAVNKIGVIAPSVAASAGTYAWTVGAYQGGSAPDGAGYRVMVVATTPALQDTSDNAFTIAPQGQSGGFHPRPEQVTAPAAVKPQMGLTKAPPVKILQPHSGETWTVGQNYMINWTADTKPDDGFTVDLLKPDGTKVRTLLDGGAEKRPDGSWLIWGGAYCNDPAGDYRIRITSWYAQKSMTSGIVHAVAKTKKTIVSIPVEAQNGLITATDLPNADYTYCCGTVNQAGRARVGFEISHGGGYDHFEAHFMRSRLTCDLSQLANKQGDVESATLQFGDHQKCSNCGSSGALVFCAGSVFALESADFNKWNTLGPQPSTTSYQAYPLTGWSSPANWATGVDVKAPVVEWLKKTKPNHGFLVTGADEIYQCPSSDTCRIECVSFFHPIMYVTFIETQCGAQ